MVLIKYSNLTTTAMKQLLTAIALALLLPLTGLSAAEPSFRALVLTERGGQHESFTAAALEWLDGFSQENNFTYEEINSPRDIDWEYPTSDAAGISSSPDDTRNYTLLMHELRRALGKKRLLSLASVSHAEYIDFKAVEPYVDFVNVMAYDIAVPPRHHAALYPSGMTSGMCGDEAVNRHIKAGIPARKLVLGMPFYGRGGKDPGGFCDYSKLVTLKEYTPQWDDEAKAPYLVDGNGRMVYTYETPRSIACKCEYIKQHGLLGAMYWEYGSDDSAGTLRKAVYKGIFGE